MKILNFLTVALFVLLFGACSNEYTPKPKAYFRIDFPKKEYQIYDSICPYSFEYPIYGHLDQTKGNENCWKDMNFKSYNAKIYLSYKKITQKDSLNKYIEDSHTLAYKHSIKADAITEQIFINQANKVYGVLYRIKGNAATPIQFHVTDSTHNFLRASLYFNNVPNKDSLAPVIDFLNEDIVHLMETLHWK